ncbi:MAG TPA: hypothetical protein ENN29_06085 [Candidatus Hydrogenedentes bacterium]|nr:hypothetical protein [Candidatus Hydrogenedentota bacterium]
MRTLLLIVVAFACLVSAGAEPATLRVGVLADGESELWTGVQAAIKEKAEEQHVAIDFRIPEPATAERQNELALEMLDGGAQALAISPVNPKEQLDALNNLAEKAPLVAVLRDAPESARVVFIGRDEKEVGRRLARGVLKSLPEGLKVMAFVRDVDAPDSQQRIAGFKEELAKTETVLDAVKEDKGDRMVAWANMEEIILHRPEIAGFVGFEAYHLPVMAQVVKETGRARQVRIVSVGPAPDMRKLVQDGVVHAVVMEDADDMSGLLLETLAGLAKKEKEAPGEEAFIAAPLATLETENLMSVEDVMHEMQIQVPWISEVAPGAP